LERLRYREKQDLVTYSLSTKLFNQYDLKIYDLVPLRSVFVLYTDKGEKILKKIKYDENRIKFIEESLNYISKTFDRVMKFYKNKKGDIYTFLEGEYYCIMDVLEGRECQFSNPLELSITSRSLGQLHKSSLGFTNYCKEKGNSELVKLNSNVGKTIEDFKKALNNTKEFKRRVSNLKYKNDFDNIFMMNVDRHLYQMEKSIEILEHSDFNLLVKEEDKIVICHKDLAYHNIIIKEDQAYFIDFDYSMIDLRVVDLCNLINKAIKSFVFDFTRAEDVLYDYKSENFLETNEIGVLYGLLYFPEDFYSITNNYYNKVKSWDEGVFIDKIKKKCEYFHYREEFLNSFKNKVFCG